MMKLSKRLQKISDLIDNNQVVADIGCDHGQLACSLIINNKSPYVYACDINVKPLKKAEDLANQLDIQDKVHLVLDDGIANLKDDVNTIVIAGMGFDTIKHILENGEKQLETCDNFIVQANNDLLKMRDLISEKQWKIIDERIVLEGNHYYQLIKFTPKNGKKLSFKEKLFGCKMPKDKEFIRFWEYQYKKHQDILNKIKDKDNIKYQEVENIMNLIKEELYELHN